MFQSSSLTIFLAFGIALFFLGVLPLRSETTKAQMRVTETKALIGELQNLQQRKDQLVRIYNSVSETNIQKLEAVIPAASGSTDASFLYLFLESVARESGLRVDTLSVIAAEEKVSAGQVARSPSPPVFQVSGIGAEKTSIAQSAIAAVAAQRKTGKTLVQETKVIMVVRGDYPSFKTFLNALESNLRIMDITNIAVDQDDRGFVFTLGLKTYHQ